MLCGRCHHQIERDTALCRCCGEGLQTYELVLDRGVRVPLAGELSIGRGSGCALRLDDPSVSRLHARVRVRSDGRPWIKDAGSTHGTYVDGKRTQSAPLRAGTRIRFGATEATVAACPSSAARPQRTLILRPGDTVVVGGAGQRRAAAAAPVPPERPRLRSGLALKRLANGDAVLKDLLTDRFLKLDAADVGLLVLLDGRRTLERLALEAESVAVPTAPDGWLCCWRISPTAVW